MTSRKAMWAGMDRLEGKKEGSSYKHLEKERARQGYKSKALEGAKSFGSKGNNTKSNKKYWRGQLADELGK